MNLPLFSLVQHSFSRGWHFFIMLKHQPPFCPFNERYTLNSPCF